MKFTLLAWVLSLLFAGAAVAQGVEGHIVGANSVNCRSCARRSCQPQRVYKRGDVSTLYLRLIFSLINEIYSLWALRALRMQTLKFSTGTGKCNFPINEVV